MLSANVNSTFHCTTQILVWYKLFFNIIIKLSYPILSYPKPLYLSLHYQTATN